MTGTKCCEACRVVKPLTAFERKRKTLLDGTVAVYMRGTCKACRGLARGKQSRPMEPVWRRPDYEAACDSAFMQWRHPVTAGLGARL